MSEVVLKPTACALIPGGSGIEELANFAVATGTADLPSWRDGSRFGFYDHRYGCRHWSECYSVVRAASEVIIVTTPESDSGRRCLRDHQGAASFIRRPKPVWIVVNCVIGVAMPNKSLDRFKRPPNAFCSHPAATHWRIPDPKLAEAVRRKSR